MLLLPLNCNGTHTRTHTYAHERLYSHSDPIFMSYLFEKVEVMTEYWQRCSRVLCLLSHNAHICGFSHASSSKCLPVCDSQGVLIHAAPTRAKKKNKKKTWLNTWVIVTFCFIISRCAFDIFSRMNHCGWVLDSGGSRQTPRGYNIYFFSGCWSSLIDAVKYRQIFLHRGHIRA